ncbi:MAG: hypothetical protein PUD20_05235 [bacterium]|nr:hypothetical protein [bacterium]
MKKRHSHLSWFHRMLCIVLVLLLSNASNSNLLLLQAAQVRYVSYLPAGMSQSTGKIDFKSPDIDEQMNYIEVGAKGLNVGDLILCQKVTTKNYLDTFSAYTTFSQMKNVIYQSSNPAIASVNKYGDVTLKNPGDVCLAIKLKKDASDATYYFPLHVVKNNAKLETTLSDFDAYRSAYAASTKACKTFLAAVNLKPTTKNIAKQHKLYQTYLKNNPDCFSGVISPHEEIVPGKYRDEAAMHPKTYQNKYSYTTELPFEFGITMNVHQCDVYQIDKYTYQIVADYFFQPATEVMINLYDSDGQTYDSENILANDLNAKIATLDEKHQTITVREEYADAVSESLNMQKSTFTLFLNKEKTEISSYDVIYDASVLKTISYLRMMECRFGLWDPTRYDANHMLEVKSVKTGLTGGTIELKSKITKEQLMGINYAKKGRFQAKNITVTAYLVSLNGEYGVQLMKPIPVKMTFKNGSSKIQMKYSKKLKKYQDYILSDTPEQPSISWLYQGEQYLSITPL